MYKTLKIKLLFAFVITIITMPVISAQDNITAEDLFAKARHAAFEDKNFKEAIDLTEKALIISPDDTDIQIFLGRLYSWDNQPNKSRSVFKKTIKEHPENQEVYLAYGNLEYWSKNYKEALDIVERGLSKDQGSQELILLKAKILIELKKFTEANNTINALLIINPGHEEARALSRGISILSSKNAIGLRYDYSYFDKRFDDPWHLVALDYTRQTKLGSATARVNYANRFATDAAQFEVDLYPYFSKTFYAYINTGISGNKDIFPQFRAGFSLYANLPAAFEVDAGFRFLNFTTDDTWVYTASVGKYFKNYW
ncbi:YaiO family outer membrane beta-barrel protein, partial [Flavobacterium sp. NRK1]|uniref:YaiO family outer membrane beta-barrel protein n=1 Tax=Flavobacterium sp. NRK1 TaxID=2954929 RepID=UPI002091F03E